MFLMVEEMVYESRKRKGCSNTRYSHWSLPVWDSIAYTVSCDLTLQTRCLFRVRLIPHYADFSITAVTIIILEAFSMARVALVILYHPYIRICIRIFPSFISSFCSWALWVLSWRWSIIVFYSRFEKTAVGKNAWFHSATFRRVTRGFIRLFPLFQLLVPFFSIRFPERFLARSFNGKSNEADLENVDLWSRPTPFFEFLILTLWGFSLFLNISFGNLLVYFCIFF